MDQHVFDGKIPIRFLVGMARNYEYQQMLEVIFARRSLPGTTTNIVTPASAT
jgi:hypothetical protein